MSRIAVWTAAGVLVFAAVLDHVTGAMLGHKIYLIVAGENWAPDGPVLGFAGGALSGTVEAPPDDWSFTDDWIVVEVEVRPDEPYSVNLLCAAVGDRLYVASGSGPDATWVKALAEDPEVRLRIDDRIYLLRATPVVEPAEIDAYLEALVAKYRVNADRAEFIAHNPGAEPPAPLFRLTR